MQLQQIPLINDGLNGVFTVHGKEVKLSYSIKEGSISNGSCKLMGFDSRGGRYWGNASIDTEGQLSNVCFTLKD